MENLPPCGCCANYPPAARQHDNQTQAPHPEPRKQRATDPTRSNLQRGSRATLQAKQLDINIMFEPRPEPKTKQSPITATARSAANQLRRHQPDYTLAAGQLDDQIRARDRSPSPSNYRSQQLPTRCHQPGDTNSNAPRPPSSLTTEHEPKTRAHNQQSQQQLPQDATNQTTPFRCTSAAKQLDDRVQAPQPDARTLATAYSNCQHHATKQDDTTPCNCSQQLPTPCHQTR